MLYVLNIYYKLFQKIKVFLNIIILLFLFFFRITKTADIQIIKLTNNIKYILLATITPHITNSKFFKCLVILSTEIFSYKKLRLKESSLQVIIIKKKHEYFSLDPFLSFRVLSISSKRSKNWIYMLYMYARWRIILLNFQILISSITQSALKY